MTQRILDELMEDNPWWKTKSVPKNRLSSFHRADFYEHATTLGTPYIKVLIGPRRVGKTTLVHQLIRSLLDKQVPPRNILYASLDTPTFKLVDNPIEHIMRVYFDKIAKDSDSTHYIFFDEIQDQKNWAVTLKRLYDKKLSLHFFVTGSSAPGLYAQSSESLVGRAHDKVMLTMKYRDVVSFQLKKDYREICRSTLRKPFEKAINTKTLTLWKDALHDFYTASDQVAFKRILDEYMLRGGYPEFYDENVDWKRTSTLMREAYFEKIIHKDIKEVFNIRNTEDIKKIYIFCADKTSQMTDYTSLSKELSLKRDTVSNYIDHLKHVFLLNESTNYRKNMRKRGDLKKIYAGDIGMRNALLEHDEEKFLADQALLGHIAETVANDHCLRLQFTLDPRGWKEGSFWRGDQNKEIDMIFRHKDVLIPIEMKYTNNIRSGDYKEIIKFKKEFGSPFGVLLTKDILNHDEENNIMSVPLWLFLLMC